VKPGQLVLPLKVYSTLSVPSASILNTGSCSGGSRPKDRNLQSFRWCCGTRTRTCGTQILPRVRKPVQNQRKNSAAASPAA
jgi:hypothetical protein